MSNPIDHPMPIDAALAGLRHPAACEDMAQVRLGVDAIDRALVELLAVRFGFMTAAARIKPGREHVRDEARKAQVIANVSDHAARHGLSTDLIAQLWEQLVEASIAYEFEVFDRTRG